MARHPKTFTDGPGGTGRKLAKQESVRYDANVNEFQSLIDQLYREEVKRARRLGPEGRFKVGLEICEENLRLAQAADPVEMKRRYRIVRALDEAGCYGPPMPRV